MFRITAAAALAAMVTSIGCVYHHHLLTHGGNANNTSNWKKTINSGWGARVVPPAGSPDSESCHNEIDRNGMHDVHIRSNLGYSALTVVSLGIWSPVSVEWNCAPPAKPRMGPSPSAAHPPSASSASAPASAKSSKREKPRFTNRTLHSAFAGLLQTDAKAPSNRVDPPPPGPATPANCLTDGMRQVKIPVVPLNYFYSLVTVATAGIWSPMHVAWQCMDAADGGPEGARVAR